MLRSILGSLALAVTVAGTAAASPLHSSDPAYQGAFTLLAVANASGASAKYTTQIGMANFSDHTVYVRLEFYSTNGYREGILVNPLPPANGLGPGTFWGGSQPNWEFTNALGDSGMGAVRVVAVNSEGTEDPTAVLHGYGRLWIEPYGGGRMSEYIPGLTDYEASGGLRRSRLHSGDDYSPFVIDTKPFAKNLQDTTYGGARVNVGFVNFDREHDATFEIGARKGTDFWGATYDTDAVEVTVPAGSFRQVPLELVHFSGPQAPPIFANATQLTTQVFNTGHTGGGPNWAAFASLVDGTTSASTLFLDMMTDSR